MFIGYLKKYKDSLLVNGGPHAVCVGNGCFGHMMPTIWMQPQVITGWNRSVWVAMGGWLAWGGMQKKGKNE